MKNSSRVVVAVFALVVAFTASVTYKLGKQGWRFELHPSPMTANAGLDDDAYDLSRLEILGAALVQVHDRYVEPKRIEAKKMLLEALQEVQRRVPEVIVRPAPGEPDSDPAALEVLVGSVRRSFDLAEVPSMFVSRHRLQDVLRFVGEHVSDPEIEPKDIEYAAIDGMLSTLDPHSVHMEPKIYNEMRVNTRGSFGGLGIVISVREGALTIISPIEDTPAFRAGLKAKDKIVRINDESTINMPLQDAVDRLRGKVGAPVDIWILRKGWTSPKKYTITRAHIEIRSVTSRLLGSGIGYVKVKNFQENTTQHLRQHLAELKKGSGGKLKGLVLDLRNNPGGLLSQAIRVSDLFLDSGPIVFTVGAGNTVQDRKDANFKGTEERYPMVVLVNGGSASASEIVAGALKNRGRALILGQQTFGKGSVQILFDLPDRSALKLTVAQYLTPGEVSIQSVGIIPDIHLVPVTVMKDEVEYYAGDQEIREADLDEHLTNEAASQKARPSHTVRYFEPTEEEEEGEKKDEPALDTDTGKAEPDFSMEVARDLLTSVSGAGPRRELLTLARSFFARVQTRETGKIADALKTFGVDWLPKAGPAEKAPTLSVTLDPANGIVSAGEKISVTATVTNPGSKALSRLRAVSVSEDRTFDDREFIFGHVPAGESRAWSIPLTIPKAERDRTDGVRVKVYMGDDTDTVLSEASFTVRTLALPRPHFAWSWQIDDSKEGNGDGLLQRGETFDVVLHVTNVGEGAAVETLCKLGLDRKSPRRYIDLQSGRSEIGRIEPGETRSARFRVHLREGLEAKLFKAEISMADVELREGASQEIVLPVEDQSPQVQSGQTALRIRNPQGAKLLAGCHTHSTELGTAPAGTWLLSDAQCPGWYRAQAGERLGFVRMEDAKAYPGRKPAPGGPSVSWHSGSSSPLITLNTKSITQKPARGDTVHLKGEASDDVRLVDYTIYVYTRHGRKTRSRKVAYVANGEVSKGKRLKIDQKIPLFEGINRIVVVARDNHRLSSSRAVIVHYAPDATAPVSRIAPSKEAATHSR